MGCFSFICKECGEAVLSDSFSGDEVNLWLLKNGKVLQHMSGQYNSYGAVFTDDTCTDSIEWRIPWSDCVDLMFHKDKSNGIAAIHSECWTRDMLPIKRSEDDPNQGWGDYA